MIEKKKEKTLFKPAILCACAWLCAGAALADEARGTTPPGQGGGMQATFTPPLSQAPAALRARLRDCDRACPQLQLRYAATPQAAINRRINAEINRQLQAHLGAAALRQAGLDEHGIARDFAPIWAAFDEAMPGNSSLSLEVRYLGAYRGWQQFELQSGHYFEGKAHPEYAQCSYMIDGQGQALDVQGLLQPGQQAALLALLEQARQGAFDGPAQHYAQLRAQFATFISPCFYFSEDGSELVFLYSPYELGPFTEGPQELRLPLDRLGKILRPQWLRPIQNR
ncbi:hypothetical protein CK621_14000 [Vandammella animalimorsus]|uniref:DUF3298 domain-containing protein n=1 Tax=Vandammella animalimorsus TaxID=2029117 RepID=A0A2A2ARI8_9BURK|nr:hypothetical protein CK621_14000 [Vandammella animalimorsus]